MSKIAHGFDSAKRKLASSTSLSHVHVCTMSQLVVSPQPWCADLYPYADTVAYDYASAKKSALQAALRIDETTAEKNREWINRICSLAGVTPTQLAREAGLSPSTINRFLSQEASKANLSGSTLAAIMEASDRLIVEAVLRNKDNPEFISDFESGPTVFETARPFRIVREITVIGHIRSGTFFRSDGAENPPEEFFQVKVPISNVHSERSVIALEYFTEYGGEVFNDHDLVFCVPLWKHEIALEEGWRVVINRRNHDGYVETSMRDIFSDKKGGWWLSAVDGEADKLPPIFLGKNSVKSMNDELSLSFLVVGSFHSGW